MDKKHELVRWLHHLPIAFTGHHPHVGQTLEVLHTIFKQWKKKKVHVDAQQNRITATSNKHGTKCG
jgi:hypothetical protein